MRQGQVTSLTFITALSSAGQLQYKFAFVITKQTEQTRMNMKEQESEDDGGVQSDIGRREG